MRGNSILSLDDILWSQINNDHLFQSFSVSTDSRKIFSEQIYLALKGKNFNGASFINDVLKKGVSFIIFEHSLEYSDLIKKLAIEHPSKTFVEVKNSEKFLQKMAVARLEEWKKNKKGFVIGITGSNGKTTTKELLFFLLNGLFPNKIACTQGNLNNHLGVPLTLLSIKEDHEHVIVEMGTNHPGEIPFLCSLVRPNVGIITNIGESHLEFFDTKKNVFLEKSELYHSVMRENGIFLLNNRDEFLKTLPINKKIVFPNQWNLASQNSHIREEYNRENLDNVLSLAMTLFPEKREDLKELALKAFLPENNRSQWMKIHNSLIFLDAYNANPSSMKASLNAFENEIKRLNFSKDDAAIIVGDMNELGSLSQEAHKELGELLRKKDYKHVYFIGRFTSFYEEGFQNSCRSFPQVSEVKDIFSEILSRFKCVFIKGSRSLQLESLVDIN